MGARGAILIATLTALAACAAPAPRTPAPVVAAADRGLAARGTTSLAVRTQAPRVFGPAEVAGVACTLAAPGFRAAFTAPATVEVPNLGARQPEAVLTCIRGARTQSLTLAPANLTRAAEQVRAIEGQSRRPDFLGIGLITTAMVGGLRRDRPTDVWGYPDATLVFVE